MSTEAVRFGKVNPWEVALRELAIESEVVATMDPARIKTAIVLQRCDRESRVRQLENREQLLRTMRIPQLEGELQAAALDRDEWATRARENEARATTAERTLMRVLLGGLLLFVAIGAVLVVGATA